MPSHSNRRWHDGDTMLAFAVFALVVFGLLAHRLADAANWITLPDDPPTLSSGCLAPVAIEGH